MRNLRKEGILRFQGVKAIGSSDGRRRSGVRHRAIQLEPLEQRTLLSAGDVTQISAGLSYSISDWYGPHISEDGRYVAFASPDALVAEDTNGLSDVYVMDLETDELTWVSQPEDGSQPDNGSWKGEISPDGRYVAFMSRANNLVSEDVDSSIDLFIYDRVDEVLECITADVDGDALSPQFSGDSQKLVYEFEFNDTMASSPNAATKDIVLYDCTTGERQVVTQGYDGETCNGICWRPDISDDGSTVVFQSKSTNLVAGDSASTWDVFLYDVASDTLECISVNAAGDFGNDDSVNIHVSGDGSIVTFESQSTNLDAANSDRYANIFVLDRDTGDLQAIAGDGTPDGAEAATRPAISNDGRYIAYTTSLAGYSETSSSNEADVYIYDRVNATTVCVTAASDGTPLDAVSAFPAISGDGSAIVFLSNAATLGDGTAPSSMDVFVVTNLTSQGDLACDYGDAPDTGAGVGSGDYETLLANNGPSHTIVAGLYMGASVDEDDGTLQNASANADDTDQALPDDEDGLSNPAADLIVTAGSQPTVNVVVTNTTGAEATLTGWIDYNNDGEFDNATERTQLVVASGTVGEVVTLTFPDVVTEYTGETYARFRLSTDAAASDPNGPALDGEVEDYVATITFPGAAIATDVAAIASGVGGSPELANNDGFGNSIASLPDFNGDGVADMAVGASSDSTGGVAAGAVYLCAMATDGTVLETYKIASDTGGGPTLASVDAFGSSVASIGDLDGDGIDDLVVGASGDDTGGYNRGAVYVLLMNADYSVKSWQKIAHSLSGGPSLADYDNFGCSVASLGDLNGDGIVDLAVGASGDDTGEYASGASYVLFLNSDGTVQDYQKIANGNGGSPELEDRGGFGCSVASLGDLDGDGVADLAVGSYNADDKGAVHVLFLNPDGTVKSSQKIASATGGGPVLADGDSFGTAVAPLGDLNGDGLTDLAVGDTTNDTGGTNRGAIYVLLLNADGTVMSSQKIASDEGGGPTLADSDYFGSSVASVGDLDGDGITELVVGASRDDTGGSNRGAVYTLFLAGYDYGDAGPSYPTTLAQDGASHLILPGFSLGSTVDHDVDGQPDNQDDCVLLDDEDGLVAIAFPLVPGSTDVQVTFDVTTGPVSSAYLDVWVDFYQDGDFTDSGEHIVSAQAVADGQNSFTFTVPADAVAGQSWLRVRLHTDSTGIDSSGPGGFGEVEDYPVEITGDTTLPTIYQLAVAAGDTLVEIEPGGAVADGTLDVSGYVVDDVTPWDELVLSVVIVTRAAPTVPVQSFSPSLDESGNWSLTTDLLDPDAYTIVVTATDGSGNSSSATFDVAIETDRTLYVDDDAPAGGDGLSWATAFASLQDALVAADDYLAVDYEVNIQVAGGTYVPTATTDVDGDGDIDADDNTRDNSFVLKDDVSILGGYAGLSAPAGISADTRDFNAYTTILSGDLGLLTEDSSDDDASDIPLEDLKTHATRQDNVLTIVAAIGLAGESSLDGLVITGGTGGAVVLKGLSGSDATVSVVDSVLNANSSSGLCGGISGSNVAIVLSGSTVTGNASGSSVSPGYAVIDDSLQMTGSSVVGNYGGGVTGGTFSMLDSTIADNTYYGVNVGKGASVTITGCDIRNNLRGAYNWGSLTITDSTICGNSGGLDGSLYATLTVVDCTITDNVSLHDGGGIKAYGPTTIIGSTVANNTASDGNGGGVWSYSSLTMIDCVVTGNVAVDVDPPQDTGATGGGVWHQGNAYIADSLFRANWAQFSGGGIQANTGSLTVVNSAIVSNWARSRGGGITHSASSCTLVQTTIAGNTTEKSGGGLYTGYGSAVAYLYGNIIAGNVAPDAANVRGEIDAAYNNLIGSGYDMTGLTDGTNGNQVGVDPSFAFVQTYADIAGADATLGTADDGPVGNFHLLPGSLAIDAGSSLYLDEVDSDGDGPDQEIDLDGSGVIGDYTIVTDLAGDARVDGTEVNIGAYETLFSPIVVNSLEDGPVDWTDGLITLRDALAWAADPSRPGVDVIVFDDALGLATTPGEIELTEGELVADSNVSIQGPGAANLAIDADADDDGVGESRVFVISSGVYATLSGITVSGGYSNADGGGIYVDGSMLKLEEVAVVDNVVEGAGLTGGGIHIEGGFVRLLESTISGNAATGDLAAGGGVSLVGGLLEIRNSTISSNTAALAGGGIYASGGTVTAENATLSANGTAGDGGGIYLTESSSLDVSGGTISLNQAGTDGGGVYLDAACSLVLTDSSVSENLAQSLGGGIACAEGGELAIFNSTLADNSANLQGGAIAGTLGSNIQIELSSILDNSAGLSGGGVFLSDATLTLSEVVIDGNAAGGYGGGIYARTASSLAVVGTTISANSADVRGGGLCLVGDTVLTLSDSTVQDNSAGVTGGGIHAEASELTISNVTLSANSSILGGGVYGDASLLTLTATSISENIATVGGGGIWAEDCAIVLVDSVMVANAASTYDGGAIYCSQGSVMLTSSLVTGNMAGRNGGAVFNANADLTVASSTIAGNTAGTAGGGVHAGGTEAFFNTLIAQNAASVAADCSGTVETAYGSFFGDGSATSGLSDGVDGNQVGTDAAPIDPLFLDVQTHADIVGADGVAGTADDSSWGDYRVQPDSPVIDLASALYLDEIDSDDAGPDQAIDLDGSGVLGDYEITLDLDGNARIRGTDLDIGVYDSESALIVVNSLDSGDVIDKTDDIVTLREALYLAHGYPAIDHIVFADSLNLDTTPGAIPAPSGLSVGSDVILTGPGADNLTINGIINVLEATTAVLEGFTNTGGINVSRGTLTLSEVVVSGNNRSTKNPLYIYYSTVVVADSEFLGNDFGLSSGGAIYLDLGTLTVTNSVFCGNTAKYGGAIYVSRGTAVVTNSTFADNVAEWDGSAIYNLGTATLNNCIVAPSATTPLVGVTEVASSLIGVDPDFVRDPSPGSDGEWGTSDDDYGDLRLTARSAAVNAGSNELAIDESGTPLTVDADENPRIIDSLVDAGAFEFQGAPQTGRETPSLVVTSAADSIDLYDGRISLREAIWYLSQDAVASSTITFASELDGETITLGGSPLFLYDTALIDASNLSSLTISADTDGDPTTAESRVFDVFDFGDADVPIEVSLKGVIITGGMANQVAGGIRNYGATLRIEDSMIVGNEVADGRLYQAGGICNRNGTLILLDSVVAGNACYGDSGDAGGIASMGGSVTVTNSLVVGNLNAGQYPGGLNVEALVLANSVVAANTGSSATAGARAGHACIFNSIVAQNFGESARDIYGSLYSVQAYHSLFGYTNLSTIVDGESGNLVGTEVERLDPLFIDLQTYDDIVGPDGLYGTADDGSLGDYRLLLGSLAINGGTDLYLDEIDSDGDGPDQEIDLNGSGVIGDYTIVTDLGDETRISGAAVDMGAYESQELIVAATADADVVVIRPGALGGQWHEVVVNGVVSTYDPAIYHGIYLDTLDGDDQVTVVGTEEDETVTLTPESLDVVGESYQLHVVNGETIRVDAGTGSDQVVMTGSSGENRFYSYAAYDWMVDSPATYSFRTDGFDSVTATVPEGTASYAYLYDSPRDDSLAADPTQAVLTRGIGTADATTTSAAGFDRVYGYATTGGVDTAILSGSATTANRFYSYAEYSLLMDSEQSYYLNARGFDTVTANSDSTGATRAYLYDGSGNDTFTAEPTQGVLDRAVGTDQTSSSVAAGFDRVYAYANSGGDNTAVLNGSATAANRFYSYPEYSLLTDSEQAFFLYANGFDTVTANSESTGATKAYLYDGSGDDTFTGTPSQAVLTWAAGTANASSSTAAGFDRVYAYSKSGGSDTAALSGSATAENRLYSYSEYSLLTEPDESYFLYARGFDSVTANSTSAAATRAYLYDSSGNDTFTADPTSAAMDRDLSWSDVTASGFARVYGYSTNGGVDTATLTGNAAGGNFYVGDPAYSMLTDTADSFYHYVRGFRSVTAIGSSSDTAGDRAYLFDSAGDDTLSGTGHQCSLEDTAATIYHNEALYFDYLYAQSSDEDETTDDTVNTTNLDFELKLRGSW